MTEQNADPIDNAMQWFLSTSDDAIRSSAAIFERDIARLDLREAETADIKSCMELIKANAELYTQDSDLKEFALRRIISEGNKLSRFVKSHEEDIENYIDKFRDSAAEQIGGGATGVIAGPVEQLIEEDSRNPLKALLDYEFAASTLKGMVSRRQQGLG